MLHSNNFLPLVRIVWNRSILFQQESARSCASLAQCRDMPPGGAATLDVYERQIFHCQLILCLSCRSELGLLPDTLQSEDYFKTVTYVSAHKTIYFITLCCTALNLCHIIVDSFVFLSTLFLGFMQRIQTKLNWNEWEFSYGGWSPQLFQWYFVQIT